MKILKQRRKPLLVILLLCLLTALTIIACRKGTTPHAKTDEFDPHTAMEWYYDFFKQSAEWTSYNIAANGDKSPDWSHSFYRKIGGMEIVEFPLLKVKSGIFITRDAGRTEGDNKRLAESTLSRIAFIKTGGWIMVREIDYIPDATYAKKNNYDISRNTIARLDAGFSGRLVIRKWDNTEVSRLLVQNGRITRKGRLRPSEQAVTGAATNREITHTLECWTFEICEYERQCYYEWDRDQLVKVCDPWIGTGNCWLEEYCEDMPDDCGVLNAEQCACTMFGDCGGGEEEPEEENCEDLAEGTWETEEVSEYQGSEVIGEATVDGVETRTKSYEWVISRNRWLWYHWYFTSYETAKQEKIGSKWLFVTFDHTSVGRDGTVPGESTCTILTAVPEIFPHREGAAMDLRFNINFILKCGGKSLYDGSETKKAWRSFTANE